MGSAQTLALILVNQSTHWTGGRPGALTDDAHYAGVCACAVAEFAARPLPLSLIICALHGSLVGA
eukprot:scaffold5075_cov109-Isochrysis_galbana.AAC.8